MNKINKAAYRKREFSNASNKSRISTLRSALKRATVESRIVKRSKKSLDWRGRALDGPSLKTYSRNKSHVHAEAEVTPNVTVIELPTKQSTLSDNRTEPEPTVEAQNSTVVDYIEPKEEILEDLDIFQDFNMYSETLYENIIPKEEPPDTSMLLDIEDDKQTFNMIMPIKTETVLTKEIAELQKFLKSSAEDIETFGSNTEVSTESLTIYIKCKPSQAEASLVTSRPVLDTETVTSTNELTARANKKKSNQTNTTEEDPHCKREYGCSHCQYTTDKKIYLIQHLQSQHNHTEPPSSRACTDECVDTGALVRHESTHRQTDHSCTQGHCTCSTAGSLETHISTHNGEAPYSCTVCDSKFSYRNSLKNHMMTHTSEKPYICHYCGFKSSTKKTLIIHIRTHTGEKPYSCKYCEYKASHIGTVKLHMKVHTGEKPYLCTHCGYKSLTSNALKIHMVAHTGEKPYLCKLCDYKGSRASYLRKHMKTHTGEKTYLRSQCGYTCSSASKLKAHVRTHTGEKPYVCKLCAYKNVCQASLKKHIRIVHTGERPYSCFI